MVPRTPCSPEGVPTEMVAGVLRSRAGVVAVAESLVVVKAFAMAPGKLQVLVESLHASIGRNGGPPTLSHRPGGSSW